MKIAFLADEKESTMKALPIFMKKYGAVPLDKADVVVVLGGDGFMLKTLRRLLNYEKPVFGLNMGHVGFLLNRFDYEKLPDRIDNSSEKKIMPVQIQAEDMFGAKHQLHAFNEFAFGRMSPQAVRLDVAMSDKVNGVPKVTRREVLGDGLIVATPIGSNGYYASAQGIPLPQDSMVMGVQTICSKTKLDTILSDKGSVFVEGKELTKRPLHVDRDGQDRLNKVVKAEITAAPDKTKILLKERTAER